ncbi:MAG: two-component regulator propeller domain-containing protein [Prevotella sp.]
MAKNIKTLRKLLIVLLLAVPVAAASIYLFKTLNARVGLNSSQINCIMKDSRGFVWLGTPAGLYRYDGYTFKYFQCNSLDGSSLPDSYIVSMQESLDGNIWIKTASGMCIYNPQTESFGREMKQVFARMGMKEEPQIVYIDSQKNVWTYVQGKGVMGYNTQQQLLYEFGYTADIKGIPEGEVSSISECRDGALIVYTDGRIVCCNIDNQQTTVWTTNEIATKQLRNSNTLKAFADQVDNIWLYGQGTLMVYYKKANTWDTTIGDQLGLSNGGMDHSVTSMAGDRKGNIWIGTDRSGLIRMNVNSHEMEPVVPRSANASTPYNEETIGILSVYVDDSDLLWVGTEKSGVAYYGNDIYKFETAFYGDISAMTQDQTGKVWFGTSNKGIVGYEGPLTSQKISAMETTPDGSIWVGSKQNGLTRIKGGETKFYTVARDSGSTIIDDHINALCADKTGSLWIATNGGLQVYNPRMNTFSTYTKENGKLTSNNITSLFYGHNNNLLVGTNEGLMLLNLSTTEKTMLTGNSTNLKTFTNDYITHVMQDSRGLIWVGTREGVNVLDLTTDSLNYITESEGLCNNCICGITEDKNHNIWITTSNGVCRVVVQRVGKDGQFNYGLYNYDISDGLQSNEFNMGAILTKKDGNVLLGGLYGVNWTRQRGKENTRTLPRVMLTQLFIGETEILTGHEYNGTVPLPQALNESSRLELSSNQNTFTIKFAGGNYNQSERLQFKYWLEGRDEDWRNGDALTHGVTFRNLESGKYILHVKAVSSDGAVSKQERTLEIIIQRPWWISWWMIVIYVVAAIFVFYIWRLGTKQVKYLWNKKKAVIGELTRQRNEIKSASDELRQPMARMASIIGTIADKSNSVEMKEQVNSLHFQMLQIITRISEMQMYLENPESKAIAVANDRLQLNDHGEVNLLESTSDELTAEIARPKKTGLITQQYTIAIVDDNKEFLKFIKERLGDIYNIYTYDNSEHAMGDIEVLHPNIVVAKEDMPRMTGSQLCNKIKTDTTVQDIKFVLMTDGVLTAAEMAGRNITVSADDYLSKPFNLHEAATRFNRLLGLAPAEGLMDVIEGVETRRLEGYSSSMTTATVELDEMDDAKTEAAKEEARKIEEKKKQEKEEAEKEQEKLKTHLSLYETGETIGDYTMTDSMDKQLITNIEQYVLQNMSRGHINLEEMASAMGMGRVPFYRKVRAITSKTPAELVRELRLKHACTLLERTNINLSELAINVGFVTAENFINIFKEKYGISPLEYRLAHRK